MAKTRMLKHDLRTSEKVASWPIEIRYFWVLLWGYVDDHGKGKDNALLVKSDTFPLDPDITGDVVDGWLWRLESEGVIARFTFAGADYLQVINWREHQKPPHPTPDVLPRFDDPQATRRTVHEACMKDAGSVHESFTPVLGGVGPGIGFGIEKDAHLTVSVPFDDFWNVWPKKVAKADAEKAWAKAIRKADAAEIFEAAVVYAQSPYLPEKQYIPYAATWLNRRQWEDAPLEAPETQRPSRPSKDQQAMGVLEMGARMLADEQEGLSA